MSPLADELVRSCSNMESLKFELAPLWEYVTSQWEKDGLARQEQIFLLLQKKQYFPYTYIKDIETLSEPSLPDFKFWNEGFQLGDKITEANYETAINVYKELECPNIDTYYNYYLCVDILLLCSIFENWRRLGLTQFGLDMANHVSLPQFGMSSWLYNSGASIELLKDYDMLLKWEGGKRGELLNIKNKN